MQGKITLLSIQTKIRPVLRQNAFILYLLQFHFFFLSSRGGSPLRTVSSVTVQRTTSFIPGISYITFVMIFSIIARSPRAPVFLSMAFFAMARTAFHSKTSSTLSMPRSFWYWRIRAFFGSDRILISASSFSGWRATMTGSLPINSGISPNFRRSSGSTF